MGNILTGVTTDWGFNVGDLWSSSMGIFGTLAVFVLLGIAVAFMPRLIKLIRSSILGGSSADDEMAAIRRMLNNGPVNYIGRVGNRMVYSSRGSKTRQYNARRK